ncbi:Uncharacterized protein ESCO_005373 [Escovopsis weberi]|uniref:Phosphate metabolism protein 7 n=1 Tax=Escovopsis weberi TaxID=150374 RepID=A0A0M8MVX6_ESCWE|nr:Uncharacterized protein ESCO_005373 [Escovopsis weberi]
MGNFISWLNKNLPPDPNMGSARGTTQPESVWGMIDTLVPVLVVSLGYIAVFLFFRRTQRRYYAPRTYLGSLREDERSPILPDGWFDWFGAFWRIPDLHALTHQSLDAYLFIRFLRVCTVICFVSLCLTWPILFPVNATGGLRLSQLEILSYANIDITTAKNRFFAHTFVAFAVYGFLMYTITRECIFFVNLRQAYLLHPQNARRISARTVLFTSVPDEYMSEARLRAMFNGVAVKTVWICGDASKLDEVVAERDDVAMRLEKAEIDLIRTVNKARIKALKKSGSSRPSTANNVATGDGHGNDDAEAAAAETVDGRYIPRSKRPQHRLGLLGLLGERVDTIDWCRSELERLVPEAERAQGEWKAGRFQKVNAAFIEFHTQSDAQAAYQVVTHHQALHMAPKAIGVKPSEVLWECLALPWWQVVLRRYAVYGFITAMIVFWAVPVGVVGIVSQVKTLESIPGLTWIKDIPGPILGVVSGLLPSVALSFLMSMVPVVMRLCARLAGAPTLAHVELFTQNAYFVFQIVQVFLVQTMTNAASTALVQIAKDPSKVFSILSSALPTTSNFYVSYFIVQGLTIAVGVVTEVTGLFVFRIMYRLFARTPRAMYQKWTNLSAISWGSVLPVYTNIAVISITYAVIAPIILFWATIGMGLFYLAYRYNILFVADTEVDTQGLIYPRALKQLFAGIYLAEGCMVGMFIVSKAPGPAVLMFLFLVFTILYNVTLLKTINPLLYNLPRSLQSHEEALMRADSGEALMRTDSAGAGESLTRNTTTEDSATATGTGTGTADPSRNTMSLDSTAAAKASPALASALAAGTGLGATVEGDAEKGGVQRPAPHKGNAVLKFFQPWRYASYSTLRELFETGEEIRIPTIYSSEAAAEAYMPPSATSRAPMLWVPEDAAGVSKQEIALTGRVIGMTDAGCVMDERGGIQWDAEGSRPPIWSEKVYY